MRILVVEGYGDYTALSFQQHFKGKKVSEIIDNLGEYVKSFVQDNEDYDTDDLNIREIEIDISEEAFKTMKNLIGDEEMQKHKNIFTENHIF